MLNKMKGEYGYIKSYKLKKLIGFIAFVAMIEFVVITMLLAFGSTRRVGIVFAILLVLPMAKFFIAYIICARFKSISYDSYTYIKENVSGGVYYDLALSQYDGIKFYYAICVKNGKIVALVPDKEFSLLKKDYVNWIENITSDSKYKYSINVYDKLEDFVKKAKSISEANDKNRVIDKHMLEKLFAACV